LDTLSLCRATGAPDESPAPWAVCQNGRASRSQPEEFTVAGTEVERSNGVDIAEVPSANWGWSKISHRNWHIYGILMIGLLLAFLRGNHVGHVEDIWLIAIALVGLFVLIRDMWGRRRGWLK
jgi:hypothetical protein